MQQRTFILYVLNFFGFHIFLGWGFNGPSMNSFLSPKSKIGSNGWNVAKFSVPLLKKSWNTDLHIMSLVNRREMMHLKFDQLRGPSSLQMTASSELEVNDVLQNKKDNVAIIDDLKSFSGKPEVVDILHEKFAQSGTIDSEAVQNCFPFPLDQFQTDAIDALVGKRSVIVSAPTGSGKTVCGEAAVYLGLALGKKVLYTTPLKALSNQKYSDFCKQFGETRVGLLTGDVSINRENATVIVLTTEVYRNMLYDQESGAVLDVHSVILDEFHYMNDRDRGTVWEECVIHSPREVLLVALSATMHNVGEIRDWFGHVHGNTTLITSDFRPVPLRFKYIDDRGILDLFDPLPNRRGLPRLNRRLLPDAFDDGGRERRSYESGRRRRGGGDDGDGAGSKKSGAVGPEADGGKGRQRRGSTGKVPSFGFTVRQLAKRDLLPAIIFVFSRLGCDKAAEEAASLRDSLVSDAEKERLKARLGEFAAKHKEVAQVDRLRLALRGIASHHAGLVPLWKALVEELFQEGLIKVVFATETLAAGINMPARTTVITSLSKRTGDGVVGLTANELRQMCGRAGRRGKDTVGHSVVMRSRWEGAPEGFALVTKPADPLRSKFSPNYGMVLNLLDQKPLAECRRIVERSFGSFLAARRREAAGTGAGAVAPAAEADAAAALEEAAALLGTVSEEQVRSYRKLAERLKSEQRVLDYLRSQAVKSMLSVFEDTLPYCAPGTPLLLRPLHNSEDPSPEPAVLVDLAGGTGMTETLYAALTRSNVLRLVPHTHLIDLALDAPAVPLAPHTARSLMTALPDRSRWRRDGKDAFHVSGGPETLDLAQRVPALVPPPPPPEVAAQADRIRFLQQSLELHPLYAHPRRAEILAAARVVAEAAPKAVRSARSATVGGAAAGAVPAEEAEESGAWKDFLACSRVLRSFGMLEGYNLTHMGKVVSYLQADNPLWVGTLLIASDRLPSLGPHELAAAMSCLVTDSGRADAFGGYEASQAVRDFVAEAGDMQARVVAAQAEQGVDFAVPLDTSYAGLVEAWAVGTPWAQLVSMTTLQAREGGAEACGWRLVGKVDARGGVVESLGASLIDV